VRIGIAGALALVVLASALLLAAGHDSRPPLVADTAASTSPGSTTPATTPSTASPSTSTRSPGSTTASVSAADGIRLPPVAARADYQLGQPYAPASGTRLVVRDRESSPAPGLYNVCYVNAFQTQPQDNDWWRSRHPDLLLRRDGNEVGDPAWGEILLDISTPAKRTALMSVVGPWIDGCAAAGFDAVETDNLDTWTRSGGLLDRSHALAFSRSLTSRAHGHGMAIAQKNAAELGASGPAAGFDFAVAESCQEYDRADGQPECQSYIDEYGGRVIVVEYDAAQFARACGRFGGQVSVILRDVDLTAPGSSSYRYDSC
jgi:hypothetical protein